MEPEQTPAIPAVPAIRVFISCPGDLGPQRAIVAQAVESLNNDPEFAGRVRMVAYAYENMTPARVGMDAQDVVNSYMLRPEEAELFICMFWQRMGTPMERFINSSTGLGYQSGTEYEFLTAYDSFQRLGTPVMLLYRSHASAPPVPADRIEAVERTAQLARVDGFFARFAPGGDLKGMVGSFGDDAEFEHMIRRDVAQTLRADLMPLLERRARAQMGSTAGTPVFFGLPPLTSDFVARPEAMDALRRALLGSRPSVGVVAAAALHGMGGLGKTTLARAACEDPTIRAAFPDGVLWATLGQQPDLARLQREWIQTLGGDVMAALSRESARAEIARLLARRTLLLVVDDVWSASDAAGLLVDAPTCRALITTRDANQAENAALVPLDLMVPDECRETLQTASRGRVTDITTLDAIAARLGRLPLALRIIGALLSKGLTWPGVEKALEAGELPEMREGQLDLFRAMATSERFLQEDERARYHELAIFPDEEPLSEGAVARLWACTGGVSSFGAKRLLAEFRDRSLILQGNNLHDLQRDYLRAVTTENQRRALHAMLCDVYGLVDQGDMPALPDGGDSGYGWRRLAWHAAQAGRRTALENLLTDSTYLEGKLARLGVTATLDDLALAPGDMDIARISAAIRAGAVVLATVPSELPNQITGRIGYVARLHHLPERKIPWLRLRTPSLSADPALLRILYGHRNEVRGCALSADGRIGISASTDHTLRLWDTTTGDTLHTLVGHTDLVAGCALSADGHLALSASDDETLRLWDAENGGLLHTLVGHTDRVNSCALSADGRLALSASSDRTLRLWDTASGETLHILRGHTARVTGCALSADGRLGLSSSLDETLRLWDTASGETLHILRGHRYVVWACAISADGHIALSASADRTLRLWDTASGKTMQVLEGHTGEVRCCALSADGQLALSVSRGGRTCCLWSIPDGQSLRVFASHTDRVNSCALSADGRLALSASSDRTLRLWDTASGGTVLGLIDHTDHTDNADRVTACALNSDGQLALTASANRILRVWDVTSGQSLHTLDGHSKIVVGCALSADGRLALSAAEDGLHLWTTSTGHSIHALRRQLSEVWNCALSADGRLALCATEDELLLWDTFNSVMLRTLAGHTGDVSDCALSADGRVALSASADHTLRIWDTMSGQLLQTLQIHANGTPICALSADGRLALSASTSIDDQRLLAWDAGSGQTLCSLGGHTDRVRGCALSASGHLALSCSDDQTLRVWDTANGRELARWIHDVPLICCALSADGGLAVAGDRAGGVHFLDVLVIAQAKEMSRWSTPVSWLAPQEAIGASDVGQGMVEEKRGHRPHFLQKLFGINLPHRRREI